MTFSNLFFRARKILFSGHAIFYLDNSQTVIYVAPSKDQNTQQFTWGSSHKINVSQKPCSNITSWTSMFNQANHLHYQMIAEVSLET